MNWYKKAQQIQLFRGEMVSGQKGNYYSPDKEWARQFTQSGRDNEIKSIAIDQSSIYKKNPLPKAYGYDDNDLGIAIQEAKQKGFRSLWVDEGQGQPNSVFMI